MYRVAHSQPRFSILDFVLQSCKTKGRLSLRITVATECDITCYPPSLVPSTNGLGTRLGTHHACREMMSYITKRLF